jgi:hypothetical protein
MSLRHPTIAAAAWVASTLIAAAEPPAGRADMPTGDVWVTPDTPGYAPAQAAQNMPIHRQLPTGDFWPADAAVTRAADVAVPPQPTKSAREDVATDGIK